MKKRKILKWGLFVVLTIGVLLVPLSCNHKDSKETTLKESFEVTKYVLDKQDVIKYKNCKTFKDSAVTEAAQLSYFFSWLEPEFKFNKKDFENHFNTSLIEEVYNNDKQVTRTLVILFSFISIVLVGIIFYINRYSYMKDITLIKLLTGLITALVLTAFITVGLTIRLIKSNVFDKEMFKDKVIKEYYIGEDTS
ncbi:hypothetical protein [Schnuerera sp.]|uniref:hypothetical protein n=1 Tax=Schnuerera sp. TaxID=2794844 RepID=UPI002B5FF0A9|nr:hypothetical protein [Schnuerera sp.]HSH35415.1 hypothetical protein [Schnuerera sp.]